MPARELAMPSPTRKPVARRRSHPPVATAPRAVPAVASRASGTDVLRRDRRYRRMLAYSDVVAAAVAVAVAVPAVGGTALPTAALLALPFVVLLGKLQGLYDRDELLIRKTTLDEAPKLFERAVLCTLCLWLADEALLGVELANAQVIAFLAAMFGVSLAARHVARSVVRRFTRPERCLLIGDAPTFDRLRSKLEAAGAPAELVGRMSLHRPRSAGRDREIGAAELNEFIAWTGAERIVIESQALPAEEMLDLVRCAKSVGVRVSLVPRVLDVVGSSVVFDELHGMTVLGVRRFGLTRSSSLLKRAFDLAGTTLALLASAPLLIAIAIAIKLDSKGPVLFRQTRVGRDGRRFEICKFRTMVVDAEARKGSLVEANECAGGLFKIADDPRVTRVGRFLRSTSLDELPQLFNVLWGDMSLVGPRPLVVDEDEKITGWDRRRLHLTPGMTGHWQILGSARVPLAEMVKIDYLYAAGWSLWADVKILLRTVPYMLGRRGM